ncbi:MAG: CD1107 family mobile element protein [Lachnospiraceae bacterium]
MRKIKRIMGLVLAFIITLSNTAVWASEGETEYITITVEATDDNGNLQYAIDEPVNFTSSNTFTIEKGTSHTIYVKDAAGNITSQTYSAGSSTSGGNKTIVGSSTTSEAYEVSSGSGDQEINIELELGMNADGIGTGDGANTVSGFKGDYENYEYLTDTVVDDTPAATVQSKMTTDGSDTAKKVFYNVTTAEGDTFYLVIDQGSSNAVHLLNAVTREDLEALAIEDGKTVSETKEDNLLTALSNSSADNSLDEAEDKTVKTPGRNNLILLVIIGLVGVGVYYYFNVYKRKKEEAIDAMDAMDMDEFIPEDDEEDIEFDEAEIDDDEKQRLLDELIASEDYQYDSELLYQNPDDADNNPENEVNSGNEVLEFADDVSEAVSSAMEYDEELDGEEE